MTPKANELRIGNYVYDTLGKVNKINLEAITYIEKEPHNQVKPIPLTEEWLFKFGFKKKYKSYEKCDFTFLQGGFDKLAYKLTIIENTPKYVHQLQNLYFALTGDELSLKNNSNN